MKGGKLTLWGYNKNILGERLKTVRKQRKMSQKELAKILNIDSSTVANYETGNRQPQYSTLVDIADYFSVSIDWLIGRTNNPNVNTVTMAIEGLEPRIQKILLEDKKNALPFLSLAADCLESGYPVEQVRELLKNIFVIKESLEKINKQE